MNVFNGCFLIQLKKNMLRKEINRFLSKGMTKTDVLKTSIFSA